MLHFCTIREMMVCTLYCTKFAFFVQYSDPNAQNENNREKARLFKVFHDYAVSGLHFPLMFNIILVLCLKGINKHNTT